MDINIKNLHKSYHLGKIKIEALRGVDLEIHKGDFVCIAGPSGSGKTTLLNLLGCLDNPDNGKIFFDGTDITILKVKAKEKIRKNQIGFIFQAFNLIETLNVYENIEYPALGVTFDKVKTAEKIDYLLEEIGMTEFKKRYPNELSGGQRQRVAIARAFINDPAIILADEPTANLDSKTGNRVLDLMKKMNQEKKTSLIFSTHDPEIMEKARRIIKIHDGEILGEEKNA